MNSNIVLTSKLITIDHGQYIVKVKATQENKILGSALASAHTVEEAEDKARERVLTLINKATIPSLSQNITIPKKNTSNSSPSPKATTTPAIAEEKKSSSTIPPQKKEKPTPFPEPELNPIAPQETIIPETTNPIPLQETIIPETNPITETIISTNQEVESEKTVSDTPELPLSYQPEEEKPEPIISPSNNNFDLSDAVDFSQVIDQTTIELKRLGWTQEEGKKYLLETYGKKSRHLLSDEELIEFLTYLQTQ
ncbi:MAG: hypothetical protein ACXITR_09650 [Cyanobacterium sp.]